MMKRKKKDRHEGEKCNKGQLENKSVKNRVCGGVGGNRKSGKGKMEKWLTKMTCGGGRLMKEFFLMRRRSLLVRLCFKDYIASLLNKSIYIKK